MVIGYSVTIICLEHQATNKQVLVLLVLMLKPAHNLISRSVESKISVQMETGSLEMVTLFHQEYKITDKDNILIMITYPP